MLQRYDRNRWDLRFSSLSEDEVLLMTYQTVVHTVSQPTDPQFKMTNTYLWGLLCCGQVEFLLCGCPFPAKYVKLLEAPICLCDKLVHTYVGSIWFVYWPNHWLSRHLLLGIVQTGQVEWQQDCTLKLAIPTTFHIFTNYHSWSSHHLFKHYITFL